MCMCGECVAEHQLDRDDIQVDSLVIPTFERESRYLVYKRSDLAKAGLTRAEADALASISAKIAKLRSLEGRDPLKCVLVESDWPEYEPTWRAIEKRMRG